MACLCALLSAELSISCKGLRRPALEMGGILQLNDLGYESQRKKLWFD